MEYPPSRNLSTTFCKVSGPLYRSSLSNWTANLPQRLSFTARFQHPPIPRSVCTGIMWTRLGCLAASSSRMSVVPSVEWLSTTITLNLPSSFWSSADLTASAMVRTRLRTGIMTDASTGNSPSLVLTAKVFSAGGFHLNLHIAVARIYVIKLLLARCTEIGLGNGVERLRNTYNGE